MPTIDDIFNAALTDLQEDPDFKEVSADLLKNLTAMQAGFKLGMDTAAKIALNEPIPEGSLPLPIYIVSLIRPAYHAQLIVETTKQCIARRINECMLESK